MNRLAAPLSTHRTKNEYNELTLKLDNLLEENLSLADMRRLAATCRALPIREQVGPSFAHAVIEFMIRAFVEAGDRDSLITLLSTQCPPCIRTCYIEVLLIFGETGSKTPLRFSERLTQDVRESTGPLRYCRHGSPAPSPVMESRAAMIDAFVENAMRWYEENKDNLAPSREYFVPSSGFLQNRLRPILASTNRPSGALRGKWLFKEKKSSHSLGVRAHGAGTWGQSALSH